MGNGFYFIKEIKQSAKRLQQEWTEFNLIATRGKKAKQSKSLPGQLLPLQRNLYSTQTQCNSCSTQQQCNSCSTQPQAQLAPSFFSALALSLFWALCRERTGRLGCEPMEDTCLVCMKSPDQSTGLKGGKLIGNCGLYQNCRFWLSIQKPNKLAHPLMATHLRLSSLS